MIKYEFTLNLREREAFDFFYLKSNVFSTITQPSLDLEICLFYTFSFIYMYMPTKKNLR